MDFFSDDDEGQLAVVNQDHGILLLGNEGVPSKVNISADAPQMVLFLAKLQHRLLDFVQSSSMHLALEAATHDWLGGASQLFVNESPLRVPFIHAASSIKELIESQRRFRPQRELLGSSESASTTHGFAPFTKLPVEIREMI